ncbi:MAG: Spy/CpxP family protein refolding chaperone [Longimicrobiales bacterium]
MKRIAILLAMAAVILPGSLAGQKPPKDPFLSVLFPPELVMQHRRAIDLQRDQRDAITEAIQELQSNVVSLQWELLDQTQALVEMLASPRADEGNVLEQIDEVLAAEARIKRSQMTLLVRIKNILTPEQQDRLSELRGAGSEDQFEPAGDRR